MDVKFESLDTFDHFAHWEKCPSQNKQKINLFQRRLTLKYVKDSASRTWPGKIS